MTDDEWEKPKASTGMTTMRTTLKRMTMLTPDLAMVRTQ
jgi:hypothetical protein